MKLQLATTQLQVAVGPGGGPLFELISSIYEGIYTNKVIVHKFTPSIEYSFHDSSPQKQKQ